MFYKINASFDGAVWITRVSLLTLHFFYLVCEIFDLSESRNEKELKKKVNILLCALRHSQKFLSISRARLGDSMICTIDFVIFTLEKRMERVYLWIFVFVILYIFFCFSSNFFRLPRMIKRIQTRISAWARDLYVRGEETKSNITRTWHTDYDIQTNINKSKCPFYTRVGY